MAFWAMTMTVKMTDGNGTSDAIRLRNNILTQFLNIHPYKFAQIAKYVEGRYLLFLFQPFFYVSNEHALFEQFYC